MRAEVKPMGIVLPDEVGKRIQILEAACACAKQVSWMDEEMKREVLKETQRILGCKEKTE